MIDLRQLEHIKHKHGNYASWAVWAVASGTPKSNIGVVSHFESEAVLNVLKNNIVMVGLNISVQGSTDSKPFQNFHSPNPSANDFKIRYAFADSPFYGAYMTDIIKSHVEIDAKQVMRRLKEHPEEIEENLKIFRQEMQDIKAAAPVILAFGRDAYRLLSENLNGNEYSKLTRLTHYSHRINKELYKDTVLKQIESQ